MADAGGWTSRPALPILGPDHVLSKADLFLTTTPPADQSQAPPPDLWVAGGAWLVIMMLLDMLLLGLSPWLLGLRLAGLLWLAGWVWWADRARAWTGIAWMVLAMAGHVGAVYLWAGAGVGATVIAGGMLAGFLLVPVAAPIARGLSRGRDVPPPPPQGTGVPLPILRLTADSLNSSLQTMMQELDGLAAGTLSPAQSMQLRLLRTELAGMQTLVRQRLQGGEIGLTPPLARPLSPLPPPAPLAPARPAQVTPNGLSALVVDDDPVGRTLTRLLLERAGYWVEETDDAKMALEMALMEGPDVALIAARVGPHSGLALAWCIRRGGGPPVVLLRGRADRVTDAHRHRAGIAAILGKPVSPDNLSAVLATVLPKAEGAVAAAAPPPSPPPPPPPPPRAPAAPLLDETVLAEHLSILGSHRVAQIIDSFATNAPGTLSQIDAALGLGDVEALGRAAHKLASGALTVGLVQVARLSKATDTAAKQQDAAAAKTNAAGIAAAFNRGMEELDRYRRENLPGSGQG